MVIVVIDSNILVESPGLRKRAWRSLVEHAEAWDLRIVVPAVVFLETVNVVRRRWAEERDALTALRLGEFGVNDHITAIIAEIDARIEGYEMLLRDYLDEHHIAIEPVPPVDHMEIVSRASLGRNPFTRDKNGKTKDGYRDTLIWLTALALARSNVEDEVWLVSHNTRDFGPSPEKRASTSNNDGQDKPRQLFHEEFGEELAEQGLSERVHYAISVERLEGHFAAMFAPIAGDDLQARIDAIKMDVLSSLLVNALIGFEVDPELAALPVEMVRAVVAGAREPEDGWEFSEAAGRGSAGWTARFVVDTEVDLLLVGAPLIGSEHTKMLRVVGQVTVASDGQILDISADSVEALPGDPMRARWVRRAARPSLDVGQWPGVAEVLRDQQQKWAATIRDSMPGLINLNDVLKDQQEQYDKMIRDATPGLVNLNDILKEQQDKWDKMIRDATPGLVNLNDILKEQQDKWDKMIRDATPGLVNLNDILKEQQEKWAKMIRDAINGITAPKSPTDLPESTDSEGRSPDSGNGDEPGKDSDWHEKDSDPDFDR